MADVNWSAILAWPDFTVPPTVQGPGIVSIAKCVTPSTAGGLGNTQGVPACGVDGYGVAYVAQHVQVTNQKSFKWLLNEGWTLVSITHATGAGNQGW